MNRRSKKIITIDRWQSLPVEWAVAFYRLVYSMALIGNIGS